MIERKIKPHNDYFSREVREQLLMQFNAALGPPNKADLSIQQDFLPRTMTPSEAQIFVSMCEYVVCVVGHNSA